MQTQTDWQMTESQITRGRHQNGALNGHARLQPKISAQKCMECNVRSNAAIGQTSRGICLDGEHGAVWTVPFALLASCGRMTSWPSEFQHLLAARTEALVTYTCQNVLVEPSNLIEPLLQGTSNQQLYAEQRFGVQERILIGLRAVLDAAQNTCIADVTQQSTMQMPDAGSHAQLL